MILASLPCDDYELNLLSPSGPPTLVPSAGLEASLDLRCLPPAAAVEASLRTAVHLHLFYLEALEPLLLAMERCLAGLGPFDLWVSTDTSEKAGVIRARLQESRLGPAASRLEIRICPNRGRNLGPLLVDLWPELASYELLLHLHGKRSVEGEFGDDWRQGLLDTLLPDVDTVATIRRYFSTQPSLGLLMPTTPAAIRAYRNWGTNFELASLLARSFTPRPLSPQAVLVFPVGMMFWCRPSALAPIAAVAASLSPLPPEPLPVDGTSLHALERLVAHGCEVADLQWAMLGPEPPTPGTEPRQLSVWDPQPECYLQGTALLARELRHRVEALETCRAERQQLNEAYGQCLNQIAELATAVDARERLIQAREQRIQAMELSLSWRLTAPLRRLRRR